VPRKRLSWMVLRNQASQAHHEPILPDFIPITIVTNTELGVKTKNILLFEAFAPQPRIPRHA
jgi:hypothetical protein